MKARNCKSSPWVWLVSIVISGLVDGGAKSGSRCWGTELSVGDILYIEDVLVKEEVCSFFVCALLGVDSFGLLTSSEDVVLARGWFRKF